MIVEGLDHGEPIDGGPLVLLVGMSAVPHYNGGELAMAKKEPVTGKEAEVEGVTREKLMEDLRALVTDAEELLKATANQTAEPIAAARTKAEESLKAARARLAEAQEPVMEKTKAAVKAADDYVRANPWKAVGIAAAVGFVLGMLDARR